MVEKIHWCIWQHQSNHSANHRHWFQDRRTRFASGDHLMKLLRTNLIAGAILLCTRFGDGRAFAQESAVMTEGQTTVTMVVKGTDDLRAYELTSNADLRDNRPQDRRVAFAESARHARLRTGNVMFDGLYAMAVHEALQNSVAQIKDNAYGKGAPIQFEAFETGQFWPYLWTRDLAYSMNLALGGFDPQRAVNSLLFKTSVLKPSVKGGFTNQIIQDTGSGGSYPVSTDRIVWALGASETLKYLDGVERERFLNQVWPILRDTIEQDRRLVFDPKDGLYRGEQSFLDWREQTYPGWTKDNVLCIAMSKALSVNAADYFLLKTASAYAGRLGHQAEEARYAEWAADLKDSINRHFFDADAGLYSTYLLSDGVNEIRVRRYDLLGESLAILFGVADQGRAESVLDNYPVGPCGPPVVWPQEKTVPIYHNQAIWPFVTAYWIKAARMIKNPAAVNAGIRSLERLAALNLSNMENYDFVSGKAEVKDQQLNGPVINSRRQLWSVAGYLSMVQDIVFGLETSWNGIRFQPFITAQLRNETFAGSNQIELQHFSYRDTSNEVRIHLPSEGQDQEGVCPIIRTKLNGKEIDDGFVSRADLKSTNQWDIYLSAPQPGKRPALLRMVDVKNHRVLFGPAQPIWDESQNGGITVENGKLVLHYRQSDTTNVVFNIYRDGKPCAKFIQGTNWMDDASADYQRHIHYYAVAAIDPVSGNASHLTPSRCFSASVQSLVIPARDMTNQGGHLEVNNHFEDWGQSGDTLLTKPFKLECYGRFAIRAKFSNGAGPVNTGITCAVKRLEIQRADSGDAVATGYLVMPQSGDWKRWDLSSPVAANLSSDTKYVIRISEDQYSRNMSYLQKNERYTAWPGGGETSYNCVNIAAIEVQLIGSP